MKSITALLSLMLCLTLSAGEPASTGPTKAKFVEITPGISLNIAGEDATFQEVPELGAGKFLCFWSGDALLAVAVGVHEKYDKDFKSFLAFTERGMKAQGAKGIKMAEISTFKTADDAEVRRFEVNYKSEGTPTRQAYYFVKSEAGYFSVIITLLDANAYDSVVTRTDKLLAGAKAKPASK